ncbi:hypothetical protein EZV73_07725 [Acidaminobacter sp. JC074]|uniref:C39 family peptidase n=1 Tax=Acidaminobacter sp. JC074 TaxID=2530199 RepID=UPI001F10018A|nr:C39 family peptidase [Acidaminobacter sp. JC074]MCH4887455.1 hypothetical protein [Acidaminobacter sp. JC074]
MMYHFTKDDFADNQLDDVTLCDDGITSSNGVMTSKIIEAQAFNRLLASWNTFTEGFVEVEIRVLSHTWSNWLTYGKWSDQGRNEGSVSNQNDGDFRISIDEVISSDMCEAFQYRIWFSDGPSTLNKLSVSTTNQPQVSLQPVVSMDIEVPKISQMTIPEIGNIICSPASLAMVMNYYGAEVDVIDTSQGSFDNGASIYGNWAYNVAYAGERGFDAFVEYCYDTQTLVKYIQQGMPIVASIKTREKEELAGAPQAYPAGHLVVIRGFEKADDNYILVNDPASKTEESVFRKYKLNEFLKSWNNVIYVVKPQKVAL